MKTQEKANTMSSLVKDGYYVARNRQGEWYFASRGSKEPANRQTYPNLLETLEAFSLYQMEGILEQIEIDLHYEEIEADIYGGLEA